MENMVEVKVFKPIEYGYAQKQRVAAYCRVSTDGEDKVNSFMAQIQYYSDYIRSNPDMQLVNIYADEGITGTSIDKRDEFKRLLRDCENKKIDRVLVKSVTRFARNSLECIETVRKLRLCGVSVFFENDKIDTEKINSEMILYIKSAFAQGEALSASKRMTKSNRMRMENGTYVSPKAPYGYRLENKKLIIVPEEAEIIKEIFKLYLSGVGISHIENLLNTKHKETRWTQKRVRYILTNEKYVGDSLYQKRYSPCTLPYSLRVNRGELPQYLYSNTQEPIVTREEFETVGRMIDAQKEKYYKPQYNEKSLYIKRIVCAHCGWAYKRVVKNGKEVWVCTKKGQELNDCHAPALTRQVVDRTFMHLFNRLKANERYILDDTITLLGRLKGKITRESSGIQEIDSELATLGKQYGAYGEMYAKGILNEATYYERSEIIKGKMSELRSQRMKLLNENEDEMCIDLLRSVKKAVHNSDYITEPDIELMEKIIDYIKVNEDNSLTFVFYGGLELKQALEG